MIYGWYIIQTVDVLFRDLKAANISVVATEVYQDEAEPIEEMARIQVGSLQKVAVWSVCSSFKCMWYL